MIPVERCHSELIEESLRSIGRGIFLLQTLANGECQLVAAGRLHAICGE